jgi:hypothetical protein
VATSGRGSFTTTNQFQVNPVPPNLLGVVPHPRRGRQNNQKEPTSFSRFFLIIFFYAVPPTLFYEIYTHIPDMHRVAMIVVTL